MVNSVKNNMMFALRTLIVGCFIAGSLMLQGCMASHEDILGEAPMTSEEVIRDVISESDIQGIQEVDAPVSRDAKQQYHYSNWATNGDEARSTYVSNESLVLYFYPKRDALGSIEPGYSMEIPLYQQVHMSWGE